MREEKEHARRRGPTPRWGSLERRAAMWELATATSLLYAGADVLIMYHPEAATALRRAIVSLMD